MYQCSENCGQNLILPGKNGKNLYIPCNCEK